ncbi:MAG: hypothetical protein CFE40_05535 [Burkholderiales bacterium PBB1]|nr:MAG: hypothetical protein CFE40_05535 [Burkholderiales bacterium PBB1]
MMRSYTAIATAMVCALASGCSDQSELAAAKKRIAQLEAELAAERAKPLAQATLPEPQKPAAPPQAAAPEPTPEPTGQQWSYEAREDKMTGGTTRHAYVLSTNTVNFDSPYSGAQRGRLVLRTDPKYGRDVIFSIERGQLLCRSYEDCDVLIRFDDGKPERFSAIGPEDNSSDTVFVRNYDRFTSKLSKAKIVRLSMNVYQEGAPVFEFDVSGFDAAKYAGKK